MEMAPGARLGHYEIVGPLGAGGMGEVYRARDTRLQRPAAIKIIGAEATDPDRLKRLEREALSASALNHPNILTVYEFGEHAGVHYIATELIAGETLRQRIERGPVPVNDAIDVAIQIAAALDAAHAAGIVHRDVKPENVMVRPDGYVKVLDFGIAKMIAASAAAAEGATLTMQTTPGMIVGTAGYMSPEQVRGLPVDHRSDIWSFGVVLHEMLTGRSPFSGRTTSDVIAAILERTPPALANEVPAAAPLQPVLDRALAKDESARYQSMNDAIAALREIRHAPPKPEVPPAVPTTPPPAVPGRNRFSVAAAVTVLVIALTAVTAWVLSRDWPGTGTAGNASAAAGSRVLRYSVGVEPIKGGTVVGPKVFSSGTEVVPRSSRFSFRLRSDRLGYVYLVNDSRTVGGNSVLTMLFPTPFINEGSAEVKPDVELDTGNFLFGPLVLVEDVWIVWSAQPQETLEAAKRFVNERDRGRIRDEQMLATIHQLFEGSAASVTTAAPDPATNQMVLSGPGDLLIYRAQLRTHVNGGGS